MQDSWHHQIRKKFKKMCLSYIKEKFSDYKIVNKSNVYDTTAKVKCFNVSLKKDKKELLLEFQISDVGFELCDKFDFETMLDEVITINPYDYIYCFSYKTAGEEVVLKL